MATEEQSSIWKWLGVGLLMACLILVGMSGLITPRPLLKAKRINCVNNLKQVGLGMKLYAVENEDMLPWEVSTNKGGAKEWIGKADIIPFYLCISNELPSPKVLVCPSDKERENNRAFSFTGPNGLDSNTKVSYLLNLTARGSAPNDFLLGDRNLSINGRQYPSGYYLVQTQEVTGWGTNLHNNCGNMGLMDGSVWQISNNRIQRILQKSGKQHIGLAIP